MRLIDANALKVHLGCDGNNKYRSMIMHEIADQIDERPTIDAVPVVHAKWNTHTFSNCVDTYGNPDTCAECSECGFRWLSVREAKCWFHYCPDCGAKMDGQDS